MPVALAEVSDSRLILSAGVVGAGRDLFERAVSAGHEGVMAKQLAGRYQPGKRSSAWQ
jgi:ATP-dependent DNA ligase